MALTVKNVKVKEGDTLTKIAEENGMGPSGWRDLYLMNVAFLMQAAKSAGRGSDKVGPDFIWPGTYITIVQDIPFEPSGH